MGAEPEPEPRDRSWVTVRSWRIASANSVSRVAETLAPMGDFPVRQCKGPDQCSLHELPVRLSPSWVSRSSHKSVSV